LVKLDAPLGFIPSPAKLEMIRIQSNRKSKNQPQSMSNAANRVKASTLSKRRVSALTCCVPFGQQTAHVNFLRCCKIHRQSTIVCFIRFCQGLDVIDHNIPGFNDDNLGNDGDGDNNSLTKSKLNLNTNKDKKKPFFKKVRFMLTRRTYLMPLMQVNDRSRSIHFPSPIRT
jgi:hypothetical protein